MTAGQAATAASEARRRGGPELRLRRRPVAVWPGPGTEAERPLAVTVPPPRRPAVTVTGSDSSRSHRASASRRVPESDSESGTANHVAMKLIKLAPCERPTLRAFVQSHALRF